MNKTVLIADDDADVVDFLSRRCTRFGLNVLTAHDAVSAMVRVDRTRPDVVVIDKEMPRGDGMSVCEMMASHADLRGTPVVMLTGSTSPETVKRCHDLCLYYVPKGPDVWQRVEPILAELFPDLIDSYCEDSSLESNDDEEGETSRAQQKLMDVVFATIGVEQSDALATGSTDDEHAASAAPWVLSIEDDDDVALALKLRLKEIGLQVVRAAAGAEGYRKAFLNAPQAIILDYELPHGNGDYVIRRLKESPATREIPVIVLTGRKEGNIERQMRNLGAAEFLTKPFDWPHLRSLLQALLTTSRLRCHKSDSQSMQSAQLHAGCELDDHSLVNETTNSLLTS